MWELYLKRKKKQELLVCLEHSRVNQLHIMQISTRISKLKAGTKNLRGVRRVKVED